MAIVKVQYGNFNFDSAQGYPTPKVTFGIEKNRTAAGDYLSEQKTVTLNGQIYTKTMRKHDGDPPSFPDGGDDTAETLFLKASGLKSNILNNNYKSFGITCGDFQHPLVTGVSAVVENLSFSPSTNNWAHTVDYEITLKVYATGSGMLTRKTEDPPQDFGYYVQSVTDTYNLETLSDQDYLFNNEYVPSYKLSRTVSAVGQRIHPKSGALHFAKKWVKDRLEASPFKNAFNTTDFHLYNQERSINSDESAGNYSVTDSFVAKSGDPWIEYYDIKVETESEMKRKVRIEGTIQGLEPATGVISINTLDDQYVTIANNSGIKSIKPTYSGYLGGFNNNNGNDYRAADDPARTFDSNSSVNMGVTKYHNAVSGFNNADNAAFSRALAYDSVSSKLLSDSWRGKTDFSEYKTRTLNPVAISSEEALFPYEGKITYSREFDTRIPAVIKEALIEDISVSQSFPTIRTKEIEVLGRRLGPLVIEYYNSYKPGTRTVTYEGTFPSNTGLKRYSFPQDIVDRIDNMLKLYVPLSPYSGYLIEDTEKINIVENTITKTMSWEYTRCP